MIVFLHFHKAAGMSMIEFFRRAGYRFHDQNRNGNPWNRNGPIFFWRFSPRRMINWTSNMEKSQKKKQILVAEWNFFPPTIFHQLPSLTYVTCIRNPWKRYLSNYFYEPDRNLSHGFIRSRKKVFSNHSHLLKFSQVNITRNKRGLKLKLNYNKNNYYVRMLNGLGQEWNTPLDQNHLDQAKEVLSKFDVIIVIEMPESFQQLKRFSEKQRLGHSHRGKNRRPQNISPEIIQKFKKLNQYDYQLYEFAKKIVKQRIDRTIRKKYK